MALGLLPYPATSWTIRTKISIGNIVYLSSGGYPKRDGGDFKPENVPWENGHATHQATTLTLQPLQ